MDQSCQVLCPLDFSGKNPGVGCPPFPNPGIELSSPASPVLQMDSLPLNHQGNPFENSKCQLCWVSWLNCNRAQPCADLSTGALLWALPHPPCNQAVFTWKTINGPLGLPKCCSGKEPACQCRKLGIPGLNFRIERFSVIGNDDPRILDSFLV